MKRVAPKIAVEDASTGVCDDTASITIAYMENNAPKECEKAFRNSSFGVYFISFTSKPLYL